MNPPKKRDIPKLHISPKARRRVHIRSALLLTLCACFLVTAGRIVLLLVPALIRPVPELLLTLLAFGGSAYLGLFVIDGDQRRILPLVRQSRRQILLYVLLGAACVFPMTLLSDLWRALFAPGAAAQASGMAAGTEASMFLIQMLKSALIAPVCEELFFRGYLLGALDRFGRRRAALASALCFALAHGVSVGGLAVHTLLGLLLALIVLRAHSLYAAMLVHGCYNLTIVLISYSGLTPLFDRLSLLSCVLRLIGCAAFVLLLGRAYAAGAPSEDAGEGEEAACSEGFSRYELALIAGALALMLLAAASAPVVQAIQTEMMKAAEAIR